MLPRELIHPHFGSLLPVSENEIDLMRLWRNAANVRANMYTQHEIDIDEHKDWWKRISKSTTDHYYIYWFEQNPCGVVSFNDISLERKFASWAFYTRPNAARGTGTRMEYLALDMFFFLSEMQKLNCEVLAYNQPVVRMHKKFGFLVEEELKRHAIINGKPISVIRLAIQKDRWLAIRNTSSEQIYLKMQN